MRNGWAHCGAPLQILLVLFSLSPLWAAPQYPAPTGYVTDAAHILDAATKSQLESDLAAYERQTSNEIAIATITSLEGETIETYANELFRQWKIGKKSHDNGVLILVAVQDRQVRIEVGYGLEAELPDGFCGDLIRITMTPSFRNGAYGEGLLAGAQAIMKRLNGEPDTFQAPKSLPFQLRFDHVWLLLAGLFVLPFTVLSFLLGLVLYWKVHSFVGFLVLPIGLLLDIWRKRHFGSSSGRYYSGGSGFGGFGGGGFGGGFGGFGGGSSGGGGASGRW